MYFCYFLMNNIFSLVAKQVEEEDEDMKELAAWAS